MNDTSEQMIISFKRPIKAHQEGHKGTTVSIAFDYSLRPGLEGLYRSQVTGNTSSCSLHFARSDPAMMCSGIQSPGCDNPSS